MWIALSRLSWTITSPAEAGHELHGKLNGGGTPLTIHTSDGNVKIESPLGLVFGEAVYVQYHWESRPDTLDLN